MKITRALSIRQPFAEQIITGEKTVEYRTLPTNIRERVYIYASQKYNAWDEETEQKIKKLPKGVIVGTVEIIGCKSANYFEFEWHLSNPKRLKKPLKPKNKPQPVWFKPF